MTSLLFILNTAAVLHAQMQTSSATEHIVSAPLVDTTEHAAKSLATPRAIQGFEKKFPGATGISWTKAGNNFAVRFTQGGIQHIAFFTPKGACNAYIRIYYEKDLPADVRTLVKDTYPDCKISLVKEVNHYGTTAYLVTIEGLTTWKTIRVVNGEMDVYEDYKKG